MIYLVHVLIYKIYLCLNNITYDTQYYFLILVNLLLYIYKVIEYLNYNDKSNTYLKVTYTFRVNDTHGNGEPKIKIYLTLCNENSSERKGR
jgi:hypothetical protein